MDFSVLRRRLRAWAGGLLLPLVISGQFREILEHFSRFLRSALGSEYLIRGSVGNGDHEVQDMLVEHSNSLFVDPGVDVLEQLDTA